MIILMKFRNFHVKRETADEVMICNITAIKVKECLADDVIIFEIIASLDGWEMNSWKMGCKS